MNRSLVFAVSAALGVAFAQAPATESGTATFQAQTRLAMVPFHAARGKVNAADLTRNDVTLLVDGKRVEPAVFDAPSDSGRAPVELVLLFDANPPAEQRLDPIDVYRFIPQWTDTMSRALLQPDGAEVRVSVFRCFGQKLYRVAAATADPGELGKALRGVLGPFPSDADVADDPGLVTQLHLPKLRDRVNPNGLYTNDYVTSTFYAAGARGWTMEAAIGLLEQMSQREDRASRVLVMFGEGIGATTTVPEDIGDQALDLGIPIYPIATNYRGRITSGFPRNLFRMRQFESLGKLTGGRSVEFQALDAATLGKVLADVRRHVLDQYAVGYVPESGARARSHNIEVRAATKKLTIEGGKRRAVY